MSYSDVKYESFLDTVSDLISKEQVISVKKVMALTGGSNKTIIRYFVQYFDDKFDNRTKLPVPGELTKAFNDAILRQGLFLNKEINDQLIVQARVIREIQGINAEFLSRCDEKNNELLEMRALYESKCLQLTAERAAATKIEDEIEKKLDEVSGQCVATRRELVDIKIENARLSANLEHQLSARDEMRKRFETLECAHRQTLGELQKQQVIAASARSEAIAAEEQLMSLHAILAQRDREISEIQDRLLQTFSRPHCPPKSSPTKTKGGSKRPISPKPPKK